MSESIHRDYGLFRFFVILLLFINSFLSCSSISASLLEYPEVKRTEWVTDEYFGVNISDPYRWLEDLNSEATQKFIEEQNDLTYSYIENSQRDEIRKKLGSLWNYTETDQPRRAGQRYFFFSKQGGQNQSVYYYKDSNEGPASIVLDPNSFSEDNTDSLAPGSVVPSSDGQLISYGISKGGSDWYSLYFKNVSSGQIFPEILTDIKLSDVVWTPGNKGVIYAKYNPRIEEKDSDVPITNRARLYYHEIGTSQTKDVLIVDFPSKLHYLIGFNNVQITSDNKYLILTPYSDYPYNFAWYTNIEKAIENNFQLKTSLDIKGLDTTGKSSYTFLANSDSILYFLTSQNASNRKIVSIDLKSIQNIAEPRPTDWHDIVPEENNRLDWAFVRNKNILILSYLKDVKNTLELRHLENGTLIKNIPIENGFIVDPMENIGNFEDEEFYFKFQSYLTPGKVFRLDFKNADVEKELVSENIINAYNSSDYKATQVFYHSKDGTKIPMFILHKRDYVPQGDSNCFLYSYGGFGFSLFYQFEMQYIYFLKSFDGIVALPSIRGGGEYGKNWHDGGKRENKQNSFDDFVAAAEYLIRENYTKPSKIVIDGISNGGLLVAATINQHPELFGAAIARSGVLDMLRFQKKTDNTHILDEYGTSDNKEDFQNLIKYSPVHNVKLPENESVQYPATLVVTGDKDDRVAPFHSYKFIAELQYKIGRSDRQTHPLLLRVDHNSGHGSGKSTTATIEEWTDIFSFISRSLNTTTTVSQAK